MRRSTETDGNASAPGAAFQRPEQQASSEQPSAAGDGAQAPSQDVVAARCYLELLGGGDVPHLFQPYYDPDRKRPDKGPLARCIYGRLSEVWPELLARQRKGAAIAVTMAETDGGGRKAVNMVRPRAVWIEADGPLPRDLPLLPSITVETSPGKYHYVYVVVGFDWQVWHGVQQLFIDEYGSDPRAGLRTQVLRMPGTLHQKNPTKPHLVRIVEELTSGRAYAAAEIAGAFPPKYAPQVPRQRRRSKADTSAAYWDLEKILSAFVAIDARLQKSGPFVAQGPRPDDQAIEVNWCLRAWWLRAISAVHHASGGSDAGYELSCQVSGGDASKGLVGCPEKFNEADQRRVWDSLSCAELRFAPVTMGTIYWISQRYCGWNAGRRGRPWAQPREASELTLQAQAVAAAGRRAIAAGLDRVRQLHADVWSPVVGGDTLKGRVMASIRERLSTRTGVAAIENLTRMAGMLGCAPETLRRYVRRLAQGGLIIKNEGNAASMLSTSGGITIALVLPDSVWDVVEPQQNDASQDPPIFDKTGTATPQFEQQAGWDPSRSAYSHAVGGQGASGSQALTGQDHAAYGCYQGAHLAALWSKPDLTLGEWIEAGVIHAEFGDHMEDLADKRGRGAVSRVLVRLNELRALRKSFAEIRRDAERAADTAARTLARKNGKQLVLTETDIAQMVRQASPAGIYRDDAAAFVREMARHLDSIIREAQGHPDPWGKERRERWRQRQQQTSEVEPKVNAYEAARQKRDPGRFS